MPPTVWVRANAPSTVAGLLAALDSCGAAVEGEELVFAVDPLAELLPVIEVLHTGIRAVLTSRKWFGCGSTRKTAAPRTLDPVAQIPAGITLLCVEGDQSL